MTTSIVSQHHQLHDWLKELGFFKDEMKVLDNRLLEVASKGQQAETMAMIERFQNKMIILNERHDEIKHAIGLNKDWIGKLAAGKPENTYQRFIEKDEEIHDDMADLMFSFRQLRKEFYRFLTQVN